MENQLERQNSRRDATEVSCADIFDSHRLPRRTVCLLLALLAIPVLAFLLLGNLFLSNVRYSRFYDWNVTRLEEAERTRLADSRRYLSLLTSTVAELDPPETDNESDLNLRLHDSENRTIAFLLARLDGGALRSWKTSNPVKVVIFNTHRPPEEHVETLSLANVVTVVTPNATNAKRGVTTWGANLTLDRALAFRHADREGCKYGIFLEDDAIAGKNILTKLRSVVEDLERRGVNWGFVKLFYTEFWAGWSLEVSDFLLLLASGFTLGVIITSVINRTLFRSFRIPRLFRIFTLAYFTALACLILWALGKQNVLAPLNRQPGLYERGPNAIRAVGVANMHPRRHFLGLADYLEKRACDNCMEMDDLVDEWAFSVGAGRWELVPHLFQHLGVFSSTTNKNQGNWKYVKISTTFDDSSGSRLFGENGDLV
ncbi:hypothetical protein HDU93_000473 [Gonapodya sp. JEL0774]|nr:hypothetical protein HDU93_000473 [Gonapodya sp. JEL0774]